MQSVAAARAVAVTPPVIGVARRRSGRRLVQGSGGAAAERRAAGQCQRHRDRPGRAGAGQRPVRLRQVHAVPRAGRRLAVRRRHHHGAEKCPADDAAAAALFSDRALGRRGRLSGASPGRSTPPASPNSIAAVGLPALGRAHRGGGALEPDAVARRAAAARHRPRASCMRPTICSSTRPPPRSTSRPRPRSTGCWSSGWPRDHRVDRPPLDARRVPPPPAGVQPRRRPLLAARGQPDAGGVASGKTKRAAAEIISRRPRDRLKVAYFRAAEREVEPTAWR